MANQVTYGFENLVGLFDQRVNDANMQQVSDAISTAFEFHNQQMDALLELFVAKTTKAKTRFNHPFTTRNQPLDEYGVPRPVKGVANYDVAFPLHRAGNRIGWTYEASVNVTIQEVNNQIFSILMGDMRWIFDHVLAALFLDDGWSYADDDDDIGTLTIEGLANGDAQIYNMFGGADAGATDTHILAQANAIGSGSDNPYPTIYAELAEHSENGSGEVICFIPTGLKATTIALGTFNPVRDPKITPGSGSDVLNTSLGIAVPGGETAILGYEDSKCWIVEYPRLPAGYIVAVATGGSPPLAMREPEVEALRGFAEIPPEMMRGNFPFLSRAWVRRAGFGGWNRVGAVAYRIGNGSYAVPTNYGSPMP